MAKASSDRTSRSVGVRTLLPGFENLVFCLALGFAAALTFGILG